MGFYFLHVDQVLTIFFSKTSHAFLRIPQLQQPGLNLLSAENIVNRLENKSLHFWGMMETGKHLYSVNTRVTMDGLFLGKYENRLFPPYVAAMEKHN